MGLQFKAKSMCTMGVSDKCAYTILQLSPFQTHIHTLHYTTTDNSSLRDTLFGHTAPEESRRKRELA